MPMLGYLVQCLATRITFIRLPAAAALSPDGVFRARGKCLPAIFPFLIRIRRWDPAQSHREHSADRGWVARWRRPLELRYVPADPWESDSIQTSKNSRRYLRSCR